jgi:hypothetical protein
MARLKARLVKAVVVVVAAVLVWNYGWDAFLALLPSLSPVLLAGAVVFGCLSVLVVRTQRQNYVAPYEDPAPESSEQASVGPDPAAVARLLAALAPKEES